MLEREERQVGARMPVGIGIEQVVRPRIVLIHALLHQPHAKHVGVELEVLARVARDRGDVMDAGDVGHTWSPEWVEAEAEGRIYWSSGCTRTAACPSCPYRTVTRHG